MDKGRLEAFSDGVLAVIITIMVLGLKVPLHGDLAALQSIGSTLAAYILSFIFIGIYWNNHHHMFQAVSHVDGRTLWANHFLLFWLSLVPFATAWMSETHNAPIPTACYASILFFSAIAYTVLQAVMVAHHGQGSVLKQAIGEDRKGRVSLALYAIAIGTAFVASFVSDAIFLLVALMWIVPDRRIEERIVDQPHDEGEGLITE